MIFGKLSDFEAMMFNSLGPVVLQSVAWIRNLPQDPSEGQYELRDDGTYARVLRCATGDADEARFETHRRFVDLQYTLAGYEIINWAPRDSLSIDGAYDDAKDVQFHHSDAVFGSVIQAPGFFSIYTPADAHRPGVQFAAPDTVFKLVVKIPVALFSPATPPRE
jgi:biofilm protein TabA